MEITMLKLPQIPAGTKPFCLGALVGAVLLGYVGFNVVGWTLESTVSKIAKRQADTAVTAALASVCAAQFRNAPDADGRLAALGKTERYSRGEALVKAGFATLPGSTEPNQGVASACAELLLPEKP
jgi:hypothetical protein